MTECDIDMFDGHATIAHSAQAFDIPFNSDRYSFTKGFVRGVLIDPRCANWTPWCRAMQGRSNTLRPQVIVDDSG